MCHAPCLSGSRWFRVYRSHLVSPSIIILGHDPVLLEVGMTVSRQCCFPFSGSRYRDNKTKINIALRW